MLLHMKMAVLNPGVLHRCRLLHYTDVCPPIGNCYFKKKKKWEKVLPVASIHIWHHPRPINLQNFALFSFTFCCCTVWERGDWFLLCVGVLTSFYFISWNFLFHSARCVCIVSFWLGIFQLSLFLSLSSLMLSRVANMHWPILIVPVQFDKKRNKKLRKSGMMTTLFDDDLPTGGTVLISVCLWGFLRKNWNSCCYIYNLYLIEDRVLQQGLVLDDYSSSSAGTTGLSARRFSLSNSFIRMM